MPIAEDTKREIEAVLRPGFYLLQEYQDFLIRWIAFNRAYNDLEKGKDWQKVLDIGDRLQGNWPEVSDLATQMVSLECIGGKDAGDSRLLKPSTWVKSATVYLREQLDLVSSADPRGCQFASCRPEKRMLCEGEDVELEPWDRGEMAALLKLVYQVRCNLVHGDKRLFDRDIQTNRDCELVRTSTRILDRVLEFLLQDT